MEESWIQGLDPRIGCPSVAPDPAAIPRTFQRENPAFPLDFLPGWTPHSQDKLPYSVSWDIPGPGMVLRASQISLCHLPAIPINLRKAGLGFILGSSCCSQNIPRLHLVQVPRFPRKKGQGRDHSPKFPLLVSAPGFQKAWERHIFHGFVQAPFEPVPCCRFFIPTAHPQSPKIAQFPARPTAWDGISVPNSSLLSPLDSASGGIADGFRAELPEPLSATGRAFPIKENSLQRPEIKKAQILSGAV